MYWADLGVRVSKVIKCEVGRRRKKDGVLSRTLPRINAAHKNHLYVIKLNLCSIRLQKPCMMNQQVSVVAISFLTYQCQVWQFAQTLAFVEYSLPLVVDGVGAVARLAAQLDITSPQEFAVHPAPRLGGFD